MVHICRSPACSCEGYLCAQRWSAVPLDKTRQRQRTESRPEAFYAADTDLRNIFQCSQYTPFSRDCPIKSWHRLLALCPCLGVRFFAKVCSQRLRTTLAPEPFILNLSPDNHLVKPKTPEVVSCTVSGSKLLLAYLSKTFAAMILAAIVIVIHFYGQFPIQLFDANTTIGLCWNDTSPAYIRSSEIQMSECDLEERH